MDKNSDLTPVVERLIELLQITLSNYDPIQAEGDSSGVSGSEAIESNESCSMREITNCASEITDCLVSIRQAILSSDRISSQPNDQQASP